MSTYTELVNKLETLALDSEEYKQVKKQIQEIEFTAEMNAEFNTIEF